MKNILNQLEKHLSTIAEAEDELLAPVSAEDLEAAESELGVKFPEAFRQLYMWHNGNKGDLFLFDTYRISPLKEMLMLHQQAMAAIDKELYEVHDDAGVFKDCIANTKWIQFADNGGNTLVFLDLDPGKQGQSGQILDACDGETECHFASIKEFISDINRRISSAEIAWDEDAGSFEEIDEDSITEGERFKEKIKLVNGAPKLDQIESLNAGDEITLVGAIKPNNKTKKHQFFMRGGSICVTGVIGKTNTGLSGGPPLVKIKVKVGKKGLLGFGARTYEVLSFDLVPD